MDLIQSIGSGVNDHQITAIKKNAVVQDSNQSKFLVLSVNLNFQGNKSRKVVAIKTVIVKIRDRYLSFLKPLVINNE